MRKKFFVSTTTNEVLDVNVYNNQDMIGHTLDFETEKVKYCSGGDERIGFDGQQYLGYGCIVDGKSQMVSVYKHIGYMSAEDAKKLMKL